MSDNVITDFDIVFALHTGVTIMMPQQKAFDKNDEAELAFTLSDPDQGQIHITTIEGKTVEVQGVKPEMMREIAGRAFFMIYEMDNDDIVRCAPCQMQL